jgi:DNA-3-methyladenine glycosylase
MSSAAGKAGVRRLRRSELPINTTKLARWLIGKTLVHDTPEGLMAGRIIETEAYPVGDAAAHSFIGKTKRNQSLFLEHGHAYIYFIYGNWHAFNVSGEMDGVGGGVLIRALEPLDGITLMQRRRHGASPHELARGPGCLATALGIDKRFDGVDLCSPGPLRLGAAIKPAGRVGRSVRIGITKEANRLLRFYERGNPCVSGLRRLRV